MNFKHISMDLPTETELEFEKEFEPRIPCRTCDNENITIKRICVCPTIKDSINAFPYKSDIVNWNMRMYKDTYLSVYDIIAEEYISDKALINMVPDVHITKEHWLTKIVKAKPKLLKIKDIKLENYNRYTNSYSGFIKNLDYEMDTTDYDRVEEFVLLSKNLYNKFLKISKELGISIEIIEDKHVHLQNYYFIDTTKNYRWIKIKVFVPAGISIAKLWLLNYKQNKYAFRKKILFKEYEPFDVEKLHNRY